MKKIFLLFSFFIGTFFWGCTPDVTTVQIVRHPLVKFDFNATSSWKSESYRFENLSKVVVYPNDTAQPGQLYNRFTLQATGKDDLGNALQFIITFDAIDNVQLVGAYSPVYTAQRGLAQVQLFDLTNNNNLAAYNLCENNITSATFQVQKQNQAEKLVTGIFQMTLCNLRDTTKKIDIVNGTFTDIRY